MLSNSPECSLFAHPEEFSLLVGCSGFGSSCCHSSVSAEMSSSSMCAKGKLEGRHPDRQTDKPQAAQSSRVEIAVTSCRKPLLTGMLRCSDTTKWVLIDTNTQGEKRGVNWRPVRRMRVEILFCWLCMQIMWDSCPYVSLERDKVEVNSPNGKIASDNIFRRSSFIFWKNVWDNTSLWSVALCNTCCNANSQWVSCQCLSTNVTRMMSATFTVIDHLSDSDCDPPDLEQFNCLSSISFPLAAFLSSLQPLSTTRTSLTQFRCQITVVESNRQTSSVCGCVMDPSKHSFVYVRRLQGSVSAWHNKENLCSTSSPMPGTTWGCRRSPGHSEFTWG